MLPMFRLWNTWNINRGGSPSEWVIGGYPEDPGYKHDIMDPMDCFITSSSVNGCTYNRLITLGLTPFLIDDLSPTDAVGEHDDYIFDSYRAMDELASPLTSSESSAQCTKEVLGLMGEEYSFDTINLFSEFNGGAFVDDLRLDVSAETVCQEDTGAAWNVVIKFTDMKQKYREIVLDGENVIDAFNRDIERQMAYEWDYDGAAVSPTDVLGDVSDDGESRDDACHGKPSEKFNNDIDRSIEEFSSRRSNQDLDARIHLEPNYFGLVSLHQMKRDPAYRLLGAKPNGPSRDYVNKMNKISKINSDKYFSRINIHELSHILELDDHNIALTREIELKVLKVFQFYCKFELGHKTWIRDTNKAQRKDLIAKLHDYTVTWYPELTQFKLEVVIRRGSYSIMQRRLRRERRKKVSRAT